MTRHVPRHAAPRRHGWCWLIAAIMIPLGLGMGAGALTAAIVTAIQDGR